MRSLLGKDEQFVVETLQSLMKNEERVKSQKHEIEELKTELDYSKEEIHKLKNNLETKRSIIDDNEYELDKFERDYTEIKEELESKVKELKDLEACLSDQDMEINILKENEQNCLFQTAKNIKLGKQVKDQNEVILALKHKSEVNEKRMTIQSDLINELRQQMIEKGNSTVENETDEIENLLRDIKHLEKINAEKERDIQNINCESEDLKERLNVLETGDGQSLNEELIEHESKCVQCDQCGRTFETSCQLQNHSKVEHSKNRRKNIINEKLSKMGAEILLKRYDLLSRLFELEKEDNKKHACNCVGSCSINHGIHNWSKPKNSELLNKSRIALGMQVKCERCETECSSLPELENHFETFHPMKKLQMCTVNPWGLTFLDLGH